MTETDGRTDRRTQIVIPRAPVGAKKLTFGRILPPPLTEKVKSWRLLIKQNQRVKTTGLLRNMDSIRTENMINITIMKLIQTLTIIMDLIKIMTSIMEVTNNSTTCLMVIVVNVDVVEILKGVEINSMTFVLMKLFLLNVGKEAVLDPLSCQAVELEKNSKG